MVNPLYVLNTINEIPETTKIKTSKLNSHKYHAKIDTNLRINNLTQEVNMPLLRLVHQLYSIIADAIDYDKEQNKLMCTSFPGTTGEELAYEPVDSMNQFPLIADFKQHPFNRNSLNRSGRYVAGTKKDCWKFMDDIIENRELAPGQKITTESELTSSQKNKNKILNTLEKNKNSILALRDNLILTIFGSINIKKIKSRAALGTLAFIAEMNNMQLSLTFGQKYSCKNSIYF